MCAYMYVSMHTCQIPETINMHTNDANHSPPASITKIRPSTPTRPSGGVPPSAVSQPDRPALIAVA